MVFNIFSKGQTISPAVITTTGRIRLSAWIFTEEL